MKNLLLLTFLFICLFGFSQTHIDVNMDMKHLLGDVSSFDREKFIVQHSSLNGHDWKNEEEKMKYFFGDLDVYGGRDNGGVNWQMSQAPEDPNRPGFADSTYVIEQGQKNRTNWKNDWRNRFDDKADVMIGGQNSAMWPGHKSGWQLQGGEAVGEFMAHYIKYFYRDINDDDKDNGHPAPRFLEVVNEPLYELHDDSKIPEDEKVPYIDVFRFHRDVSRSFKELNRTTKIGGYTVAFPEYDIDNFQRWHERMKLFIDTAGADMDYYSLHLYDFNRHWRTDNKHHIHFKGSRTEATLDMLEQYGMLKFGEVKPMLFSEIGGRDHKLEGLGYWTAERDWHNIKAMSAYLLQFMERANNIEKVVPFIMTKAVWSQTPHTAKLLKQTCEPEDYLYNNYDTDYEFTEMVKLYELWADVNGVRVDTYSDNPDVLTDAYVDGNKAYLIFTNICFDEQVLDLNIEGVESSNIEAIKVKHLYANDEFEPVLEVTNPELLNKFTLAPEATAIVEFTYKTDVDITENLDEHKYYATSYLKPIVANQAIKFDINNVAKASSGEAELRVSFGRAHNKSKQPFVKLNGVSLNVPENLAGETQEYREAGFFGMTSVAVPYDLLQENNTVEVAFADGGGHISSVTLRTFEMSKAVKRSNQVNGITLYPTSIEMGINQERILTPTFTPGNAADIRIKWESSDNTIVAVDSKGILTGKSVGKATITATTVDGGFSATCEVDVKTDRVAVLVDQVNVSPTEAFVIVDETVQLNAYVLPIDADDKTITWSSANNYFASVDTNGLVTAKNDGLVDIIATAASGVSAKCEVTTQTKVAGSASFVAGNNYKTTTYVSGNLYTFSCDFQTTTGTTVGDKGVKFWFRELNSNWKPIKDYVAYDYSVVGENSGTASATIDLSGAIPTSQLPDGNFYWLWLTFEESDGNTISGASISKLNIVQETSVNKIEVEKFDLYPNPANSFLSVSSEDKNINEADFYSMTGVLVTRKQIIDGIIDIRDTPDGMYIVKLNGNNFVFKKVIVQRLSN